MHALILPLACAYFLNSGIGQLGHVNVVPGGSGPPPGTSFIVTQSGLKIVTQGGAALTTHP